MTLIVYFVSQNIIIFWKIVPDSALH